MAKPRDYIDKVGILGVFLSHACCLGFGARISLIVPSFSGFFMKPSIFIPLISISLAASMLGIFISYLKHKNIFPFLISVISSAIIIFSSFIMYNQISFFVAMMGLIGASVYNTLYERRLRKIHSRN